MQRDVRRIPHHPAIVTGRSGWDVKERAGAEFVDGAVLHRGRGTAGEHQPTMLDVTSRCPHALPDMNGPLPSGLVCCTADGHAPDANQFEFSFFEHSHFVRLLKALQNCLNHRHNSLAFWAAKRSSLPCTAQQCQTCTASTRPRESRPDAYARAFHPATEIALPMPANTR